VTRPRNQGRRAALSLNNAASARRSARPRRLRPHFYDKPRTEARRPTALSSGATPASRTEDERSETEVKAAGVVACSELFDDAPPVFKRSTSPTLWTSAAPREAVPAPKPTEAKASPSSAARTRRCPRQAGDRTALPSARRRRRQVAQPRTVEGAAQCRRLVPIHCTTEAALPRRTRTSQQPGGAPARRPDTAAAEHSRPLVAGPSSRGDGAPERPRPRHQTSRRADRENSR
jgi:hypothetical protein